MPVDQPEDGACLDPGNRKPTVENENRAVAGSAEGNADLTSRPLLIDLRRLSMMISPAARVRCRRG